MNMVFQCSASAARHLERWLARATVAVIIACAGCEEKSEPYLEQFRKLDAEMEAAASDYMDALQPIIDESGGYRMGVPANFKDRRPAIFAKMDALADRAAGSPDSGYIARQVFDWAAYLEPEKLLRHFQHLVERHPLDAGLDDVFELVSFKYAQSGSPQGWIDSLNKLAASTNQNETKIAALLTVGVIGTESKLFDEAKKALRAVIDMSPAPEAMGTAQGFLFEITHLQVGNEAPTFSTKRLDGSNVSLKSLRGKPVLLNFWASW